MLRLPLVVGIEQDGADEADDGGFGGKDADDIAGESLERLTAEF
jgi:hypothetical protein